MRKRRINVVVTAIVALVTVASLSHFVGFRHHHHHGFHEERYGVCSGKHSDEKSDRQSDAVKADSDENNFNQDK